METKLIKTENDNYAPLCEAAEIIKNGGLVAMPTETVYGLGANGLDGQACRKIFEAKGRPGDNPLIIHICDFESLDRYTNITDINDKELVYKLSRAFMPGPITMVLPKADIVPAEVTAGLDTVAVRFPTHKIARELIRLSGVPIAAPSANRSGSPSPTCAKHVMDDLSGRIEMIIDGGECEIGLESTIIMPKNGMIKLLRPGAITEEMLSEFAPVEKDKAITSKLSAGQTPLAPGMKYRHYAPAIPLISVKGPEDKVISFFRERLSEGHGVLCFEEQISAISEYGGRESIFSLGSRHDAEEQGRMLFGVLRRIDNSSLDVVYSVYPGMKGKELAVYNRLIKACGFEVIEL